MTWEQYWNGDVWMTHLYQEADKKSMERENWIAWLHGMYIYEALCNASPIFHDFAKSGTKAIPFRTEPYKLFEDESLEEERKKQEENDRLKAQLYMQQMVRAGKNWGKGAK